MLSKRVCTYADASNSQHRLAALISSNNGLHIINTNYQKLPFGSGDDPDKLFSPSTELFHGRCMIKHRSKQKATR